MASPRWDDIVRRRPNAGSAIRDHVADVREQGQYGRVNGHDALAYGPGRQFGPGHRLGPSFLFREIAFRMPYWVGIVAAVSIGGTLIIVGGLLAAPFYRRGDIQPSIDPCPHLQEEWQQPPDDPLIARVFQQGCMLHKRVGIFRDTGSDWNTPFPSDHEAQLRWADLDLRVVVEFNVPEAGTKDRNGDRQQAKYDWNLEQASEMASWGCLGREQQHPRQDQEHQTSPSSMCKSGSIIPRGLSEALQAYNRDPNSWKNYEMYFGRLHTRNPSANTEFARAYRQKRSKRIQAQCAAYWEENQEEKEDGI